MKDGIKRRDFLKVVGVGGAGATLTGCSTRDVERLIPYVVGPDDITPGVATWYTTVCGGCSAGCGMWVRTREGRAVKLEGNPNHPTSNGGLCARGHASLQHLYNPDRFHGPMIREGRELRQGTWAEAEQLLAARIQGSQGELLFITGHVGPTLSQLVDRFVAARGGTRVRYDALSDAPLRDANRIVFGVDGLPRYQIEGARFLISFGNDFLETGPSPVEHHSAFARMAAIDDFGSKGRFVYVGSRLSLTGLNADEWVPIRPGSSAALALGMAAVLVEGGADAGPYANVVRSYGPAQAAAAAGISVETVRELAERFASQSPSLALGPGVGAHSRNATAANVAVMILNAVAGNVGRTLHASGGPASASAPYREMADAIRAMAAGQFGTVLVLGANPLYSLPPAAGFREAYEAVDHKVSFAPAPDETSETADLVLPDRHFLESWGDSEPRAGLTALMQPVMQPVPHFDTKQAGDVLLAVSAALGDDIGGGSATFYEYLRARHDASIPGDFETVWRESLRTGGALPVAGAPQPGPTQMRGPDAALTFDAPRIDGDGDLTLVVTPSGRFGAGEYANTPWMLELPDPVSKIVWHSWLEMNPHTAEERGLANGDFVTVTSPHGTLEVPVWVYPGIREDTVALSMGMGHTHFGRFATGQGVNAMALLPAEAEQPSGALVTMATRVTVEPTGRSQRNVTVEGSDQQYDRPIAPAVALAELGQAAEGGAEAEHGELQELQGVGGFVPVPAEGGEPSAFPLPGAQHGEYATAHEGPRWAMAIDLEKCTGCSACVTACQAENNVPWVGADQVLMGRDMHWMRIERYYEHVDATQAGDLDVRFLPMLCQHCGNAPCEPVCPVFATYHTPEGVNAQVYNRCVGTRYCANNCPYKVRVFNWYRYTDAIPEPMNWQWNPDVTVRDNGVMEKCSFCMQRIREAENRAALEDQRPVRDGEIVTACQQSCPAEAIVFGDIRDPESRVSQILQSERTYRVLDELINTQPAVNYLKKVTFHEVASGGHQ